MDEFVSTPSVSTDPLPGTEEQRADLYDGINKTIQELGVDDAFVIHLPFEQTSAQNSKGKRIKIDARIIIAKEMQSCESDSDEEETLKIHLSVSVKGCGHKLLNYHGYGDDEVNGKEVLKHTESVRQFLHKPLDKMTGDLKNCTCADSFTDKLRLMLSGDTEFVGYDDCIVCTEKTKIRTACCDKYLCIQCMDGCGKKCPQRCESYTDKDGNDIRPYKLMCRCCIGV